jgi:hypothetical protein
MILAESNYISVQHFRNKKAPSLRGATEELVLFSEQLKRLKTKDDPYSSFLEYGSSFRYQSSPVTNGFLLHQFQYSL